jgi:lysophospholipase L1-like esterase
VWEIKMLIEFRDIMLKKEIRLHRYQTISLLLVLISFYSCDAGFKAQTPLLRSERFSKEIETFIQWDKKNSYPENAILFIGSSSISLWNTALSFPRLRVINRGFGGAHISDVNHYYEKIVRKYKPSKIIFYAGDNDVAAGKSADQVLKDYQIFIEKVERDFPETQVFYLPIKPSLRHWQFWSEMSAANSKIREFIETKQNLFYVDTTSAMLNGSLEPNPDLFIHDGLHLNDHGYQLWNEILLPYIEKK